MNRQLCVKTVYREFLAGFGSHTRESSMQGSLESSCYSLFEMALRQYGSTASQGACKQQGDGPAAPPGGQNGDRTMTTLVKLVKYIISSQLWTRTFVKHNKNY